MLCPTARGTGWRISKGDSMRLSAIVALLAGLVGIVILAGCAGDPAFTSGKVYLADKNYDKAIEQLMIAVRNSPSSWEPHMYLGWSYAERQELEKANEEWFTALDLAPDEKSKGQVNNVIQQFWLKYAKKGEEYNEAAKFERAIEEFEKALLVDPRRPDAYINLGYSLVMSDKFDEAIEVFERALEYSPDNEVLLENLTGTYANKGGRLAALGDHAGALMYFEKVERVAPDTPDLYFNLGMMHYQLRQYRDSLRYFRKHLEGAPEDEEVLYRVFLAHWATATGLDGDGQAELAADEYRAAMEPLQQLIVLDDEEITYHRALARVYNKLGRDDEAMGSLKRVEELLRAEAGE